MTEYIFQWQAKLCKSQIMWMFNMLAYSVTVYVCACGCVCVKWVFPGLKIHTSIHRCTLSKHTNTLLQPQKPDVVDVVVFLWACPLCPCVCLCVFRDFSNCLYNVKWLVNSGRAVFFQVLVCACFMFYSPENLQDTIWPWPVEFAIINLFLITGGGEGKG